LAILAAGCEPKAETPKAPAPPKGAGVAVSAPAPTPAPAGGIGDLPGKKTTDGKIAVGNLEGQIAGFQHLLDKKMNVGMAYANLPSLLLQRGQYLGTLRDYDRAEELAAKHFAETQDGAAYLERAGVRQTFHQFDEALADLDQAEKLHAKASAILQMRASIWHAQGRTQEALKLRAAIAARDPDIMTLGTLAVLKADLDQIDEADALFAQALPLYRDVSPFPVAWIDFQRGLVWEKAGQIGKAKTYYQYAVARLPQYAPAQGHLAGVEALTGDRQGALERLRKLTQVSDDPEYVGQLSNVLAQTGHADEAKSLLAKAAAGFDDLVKRHPAAFADHAARFWLDVAKEPKKAEALARLNLDNRHSRDAYQLALEATLAANDSAVACGIADGAMAALGDVEKLRYLAGRAYQACGQPEKAAAAAKPAAKPTAQATP
jgi:lipopolysaccharide biosynthesis regulator YciM